MRALWRIFPIRTILCNGNKYQVQRHLQESFDTSKRHIRGQFSCDQGVQQAVVNDLGKHAGTGEWSKLPPACFVLGELDVLRTEGEQFAKKLEEAGVAADVNIMKGQPHPFIAMDAVLEAGSRAITLFCDALRKAMYA